ncbi:uncharacterized protein LOC143283840 [Babylonia areolata]|uniref:uncharacterized protein LOC143283840 n=1 Tax=Babylonia areolata TaxID=304850 RepID=UPI003FD08460
MASWALIVYFITYMVSSIVHSKVLAVLGFRVEFLLLQLLVVVAMLVVALTQRQETVFLLSVVSGVHRTCFYTMPYVITNDIARSIVYKDKDRNPVALAMSLVAVCIPLGNCVLFSWVGALEDLTGDISTPLWVGSAYSFLGCVVFLFVGKV